MTLEFTDSFNIQPTTGGGGGTTINNQDKTITSNGEYTADTGYTGLGTVTVDVPNPSTGTISVTENGTYNVTNYASADVNVQPTITSLSITPSTSSQTITAPTGTDGYSPISVSAVTSSIDNNITASNIKKNVTILGVTGNYEPTLTTKSITQNGTYNASSDSADGYSSVTVNVTGLTLSAGQPVLMSAPLSNEVQGYKGQNETVTSTGSTYNYPNFVDRMSDFYDDGTNSTISENVNVIQKGGTMSDDFVFTGGSNTYLIVPDIAPLKTADSWEFKTKYKYTGGGNIPTVIGACGYAGDATYDTPILLVSDVSNKMWFKMWISSNGSSFDIASDVAANFAVTSGVTYYLKFGFNGTEYYLDYNTDGSDNYTRAITVTSSTKCNCTAPFMLMNLSFNPSTYYSSGTIDLKETSITINGNTWWNGTYNLQGKDYQGIKISKNNIKPFVQPVLSSNGTMGGNSFAVSASSEYSGQNGYAYKAFDGLYNKGDTGAWWATTNSNQWLTFYNPNPLCVKALNIQNGNNGYAVVQWELLGSNDNQNWTTITSGTNTDTSKYIFWTIDASSNTNYYKYYRINALTGTGYIVITEITIIADEKSNGNYWYLDDTNNTVQTPIIDNTKDIYFMVGDNYTASTTIIY